MNNGQNHSPPTGKWHQPMANPPWMPNIISKQRSIPSTPYDPVPIWGKESPYDLNL